MIRGSSPTAGLCAGLLLCAVCPSALAVSADRQQPMHVESDRMKADDIKHVAVFQGRVVVTQGTFTLCADQVTVREDKEGNQSGTALGNPATFREKREGTEEWIEGEAQRIDYNNTAELVELFTNAKVRRGKDEVHGDYISYDGKTELYKVQSEKDQPGATPPVEKRVSAVFNPKPKPGQPGAAGLSPNNASTPLQSHEELTPSAPQGSTGQPGFCRWTR